MTAARDVLRIQLLGGFTLSYDGAELPPLPSRHARLLFAWLALQGGHAEPRTLLCDRLWPEVAESRARRRLSHALWQVQDAFGERGPDRPYLLTPGDTVAFDASLPYWLDVEEFEQRLDEVDQLGAGEGGEVRHLRRCVELYRGDLLAGSYEDWVLREQERLRQRHVTALSRLVDACKQRGNFDEALAVGRRLTHQAPLREDAHREVMRLCVLLGQPSQALEQFERCRSVLAEELGTAPSAATLELRDRIARSRTTGAGPRPPVEELETRRLVGRDAERVRLVDQLERTLGGEVGTVLLEGEPGVGKTQLLVQVAEDARWRGFTVLWGAAEGRERAYRPVREAVLPLLDPVRVAQLQALVAPVWLREAGRLLPPLAAAAGAPVTHDLAGADGAERMRQALAEVVTRLATIDPVLLVLEDLHRADPETLALVRTLARHPEPGRLLLLCSFRDVDAREDDRVWEALRALDRDARPARVLLGPLRVFETAGVLREALGTTEVPAAFAEAVHRECGGNPLYVLELLRSLRDAGSIGGGDLLEHLGDLAVPVTDGLRALIRHRLDLLGDDALAVVEFGAVLGGEFGLSTLQTGLDLGPRAVTAALGELVRRNLLEFEVDRCRFTHAATRRVALDGLDDARARALHTAAADALEATAPDDVEALAHHLQQADLPARAMRYVRAAADRAIALHAHDTAAGHLLAAVALCARVPTALDDRVELLLLTESVLDVLGRRDAQSGILDDLEDLTGGDLELSVEVLLRRATLLGHVDRLPEAITVAEHAVDRAWTGPERLRGRALTALGQVAGWAGDNLRAAGVLADAVALLDGAVHDEVRARHSLATALRFLQRFDEVDRELRVALAVARNVDDEVGAVQALGALADLRAETGHTDDAVELYDEAVTAARRIGYRHREGVGLVNLATVRLIRSEPAAALVAFDDAARIFASLGNRRGTATVRLNRSWLLHRWLGADDDARNDAEQARTHFEEVGSLGQAAVAWETLAAIARRQGAVDEAREALANGLMAARSSGDQRAEIQLRRSEVELLLATSRHPEAEATASAALDRARELGLAEFVPDLAALAAVAAVGDGRHGVAARLFALATDNVDASGEPHRVHHRLAVVAGALGREPVADLHREALVLLEAALMGLEPATRARSLEVVAEHRAIVEAARTHVPRRVQLRLARADAPRGRAVEPDEMVTIALEVAPAATPEGRRSQLLAVLTEIRHHGAEATLEDLTSIFDVSASTVRRDLRALRSAGHAAPTRGNATG